ncbi:unnamed protein product [Psylliodes chrysocephalus]|uniref:Uncharacterized protein n=1 Tax=Psylliodes chrysocephalus TaxID=3402493 RepID=A0A9P0C890_9CUCU|nr:unnamed protein product [Psylliodes chrysocephala]
MEIWLRNHPRRCITVSEVPSLFGRAYLRATTPITAIKGFEKIGLYPVNRTVFTEDMFIATLPTDKPQEQDDVPSSSDSEDDPPEHNANSEGTREIETNREATPENDPNRESLPKQIMALSKKCSEVAKRSALHDMPSTSKGITLISPEQIAPYPKVRKATILASTPYKEELENSLKERNKKVNVKKIALKTNINLLNEEKSKNPLIKTKKLQKKSIESSESDDDAECFYCNNRYSKDGRGKGWIQCLSYTHIHHSENSQNGFRGPQNVKIRQKLEVEKNHDSYTFRYTYRYTDRKMNTLLLLLFVAIVCALPSALPISSETFANYHQEIIYPTSKNFFEHYSSQIPAGFKPVFRPVTRSILDFYESPKLAIRASALKLRDTVGRRRVKENQSGILEVIKDIAVFGGAADERLRIETIRFLPIRVNTDEGKRHVVNVPVKLCKPDSTLHLKHKDGTFCTATIRNLESLASIFYLDYRVKLPDHDFVVAEKHKLISSVYAGIVIKKDGEGKSEAMIHSGHIRPPQYPLFTPNNFDQRPETVGQIEEYKKALAEEAEERTK